MFRSLFGDRTPSTAVVGFSKFHLDALHGLEPSAVVANEPHRRCEEFEDYALFLGVFDLFPVGWHLFLGSPIDHVHFLCTADPQRTPSGVHGHVSASDYCDAFPSHYGSVVIGKTIGLHKVDPGQILVGEVYAAQVFSGNVQEYRSTGTDS